MTPDATLPSSPLAIRDFQLFWLARFSSVLATTGMVVVIGWQVYDLARSQYALTIREGALMLGVVGLAQFLPLFVLTPVAGWVADRYERRSVARIAMAADVGIALVLGAATVSNTLSLPLLFLLAAIHGAARVFIGPAMSSIAPNIVPPELLPRAIAMSSIAWQSASIAGPALGGLLYATHAASTYWFAAATIVVGIVSISAVRKIMPPAMSSETTPLRQMADGLSYVRGHRFLFGAITLDMFAVLLGGATAMLPVYARDILHVGPEGLGWLRAAPAAGAAVVALWFSFRPLRHNVGVKMIASVVAFGAATVVFGASHQLWLSLSALAALGGFDMLSVYVRSSLIQLHTPDAMRGRVSAVGGLAVSASNELGEVQSGLAAALLGPVGAVVAGGIGAIAIAIGWAYWFPELRRARTFDPPTAVPDTIMADEMMQEKHI
ncbi:MAG: MFS transporter [Sphingomonadales bacterium]